MAKYLDVIVRIRSTRGIRRLPATVKKAGLRGLTEDGGLVPTHESKQLRALGCRLFETALHGRAGTQLVERRAEGLGTRVWLEQSASDKDPGPWELLCDPSTRPPEHLAINILTPVIRRLTSRSRRWRRRTFAPIEGPLQILAVATSPASDDLEKLNLAAERAKLDRALKLLVDHQAINVTWIRGRDTLGKVTDHLNTSTCHVLHFVGHGEVGEDGMGSLLFEDANGGPHAVSASNLHALLAGHDVRLALLNCCRGALAKRECTMPSMAAILAQHLPAVIGMQAAISDPAGVEFSSAFYRAIAHGKPIEVAVTQARLALSMMGGRVPHPYIEWATPVLFLAQAGEVLDFRTMVATKAPAKRKTRRSRLRKVIEAIPEIGEKRVAPPGDNQKFQWQGLPTRNGRTLSAKVKALDTDWYRITLSVTGTRARPLTGSVTFHLHETFDEPVRRVPVLHGKATLTLVAWGAFTVGASCDGGKTRLELDLSEVRGVPRSFRES